MAIVMECTYGNAKIYICDDMYKNISHEEKEKRKKAFFMAAGRIAASPGAAERYKAYIEREKTEPTEKLEIIYDNRK